MDDQELNAAAQDVSNALVDAAYWVRADVTDVSAAIVAVERALESLRRIDEATLAVLPGHDED